ncbi:MAG: hypothetical protein K2Q10_02860, partial [Rhodospirillales bacterium]|nr:hypothetical protein [Rhodospirillales bacterium]
TMDQPAQPKPFFFIMVVAVIIGLLGFALYRSDILAPKGKDSSALPKLSGGLLRRWIACAGPRASAEGI